MVIVTTVTGVSDLGVESIVLGVGEIQFDRRQIRSRSLRTVMANFTKVGMRERLAQRSHHSGCAGASAGLAS
jgi:hypothetical protein